MMGVHAPDRRVLRPWWDAARLQASCDLLRPVHDPRISLSFLLPFRALLAIFVFLSGSIVTGIFSRAGKFCHSVTGQVARMDEEESRLLQPPVENLASVKVFPLIPSLKKDIVVSSAPLKSP